MNRKKYKQSISGRKTKKIIAICAAALLFAPLFSFAADDNTAKPVAQSYYSFSVTWDSEKNTLALVDGKEAVSLTEQNILKDNGTGSQFYARVINFDNKAIVFSSGDAKLFLGQWKLENSAKQGEVKVTVPYFPNGNKVLIFQSSDKKGALALDVSKLAKTKTVTGAASAAKTAKKAITPPQTGPQTYLIGGHSAAYWWTMRVLVLLVLGGGGYFIWRWRKKKKMQIGGPVNLTRNSLKK